MKESPGKENLTNRPSPSQFESKVIHKCKKQRSLYIRREVGNLIQRQLKIYFATEKLEKELEDKDKGLLAITPLSTTEKLHKIRVQEREKQWKTIEAFNQKKVARMKKLAERIKQKQKCQKTKSSQNFFRMAKAHKKYEENLEKEKEKIQSLKSSLIYDAPRTPSGLKSSNVISNESLLNRIKAVKQEERKEQSKRIESYLNKLSVLEERKIKKEIKEVGEKDLKQVVNKEKGPLTKRAELQERIRNERKEEYERKLSKFETNRQLMSQKNNRLIRERSAVHYEVQQEVLERKQEQQESLAQMRIILVQEKLAKITMVTKRNEDLHNQSAASFAKNIKKSRQNEEKEEHNQVMRQISNVINRLRNLGNDEQLPQRDIDLLLYNLDPNEKSDDYKLLTTYINSTKEKFLEQKHKEEEERVKKIKKNNQKIL